MAVGNPFNLSSTVTTGIVSAVGRHTGGIAMYQNFIQTDAAINPGNSGGALINIEGELIGINTMIYTRSGGYMGIGFAIPIKMAKRIMEQLLLKGSVERGWLGVQIGDIDQSMKEALGLKSTKGVLINEVFKGQPADKAGIRAGDVVLSIDGIRTGNANELKNTVAGIEPGKKASVEIVRDGNQKTVYVVLSRRDEKNIENLSSAEGTQERQDGEGEKTDSDIVKKAGISVGDITPDVREKLNLNAGIKGVVVLDVDEASWAGRKGLKKNDIIQSVKLRNSDAVILHNAREFRRLISGAKSGESVMISLLRDNRSFFIAFKIK
jgi:serine protease Do